MPAPVFNFNGSKRPTEFGRISVPDDDWLALQAKEEALLPELPVIDPHHHLWEYPGYRYLTSEFSQDIGSGHNVVATVYAECVSRGGADGGASGLEWPIQRDSFLDESGRRSRDFVACSRATFRLSGWEQAT